MGIFRDIVIMGIHRLPEIDNYWSSDWFLGVKSVCLVIGFGLFGVTSI